MDWMTMLKTILFGAVEGITEWLPISSTGHMILLGEFVALDVRPEFWDLFLVVVQLGAILAVVALYFRQLWPFAWDGGPRADRAKFSMWLKIAAASVPAALVGLLLDEQLEALFYNWITVAVTLILFGVLFIVIENCNRGRRALVHSIAGINYRAALVIGVFQMIAAVFPGTSRSGATIIGALLIGISRTAAAEFTFFLAVPAMFGASALKLLRFEGSLTGGEWGVLLLGMAVAFAVSIAAIRFLMGYIKKHDFKIFGWYRIALGALVIGYFLIRGLVSA